MAELILIQIVSDYSSIYQCNKCGAKFKAYRCYDKKFHRNFFCSRACANKSRIKKEKSTRDLNAERFERNRLRMLYQNAAAIEVYTSNPGISFAKLKELTGIEPSVMSRAISLYLKRGSGHILTIESGIDTPKAILQEIELSFKENTSVLNITQ